MIRKWKYLLIFFSITTILFSSCKSEEEKNAEKRMEELDQLMEDNKDHLHAFFAGIEKLRTTIKKPAAEDLRLLSPSDTFLFHIMKKEYSKTSFKGDELIYEKSNSLVYYPTEDYPSPTAQFQFIRGLLDQEYYHNIYDRYMGEEWHMDISDPDDYRSEESRDEIKDRFKEVIRHLAETKYLIGVEEMYLKPGAFINDDEFTAGEVLCRIYALEVATGDILQTFLVRAENSLFVMTFSGDDLESRNGELLGELRQQVYENLLVLWSEH